MIKKLIKYSNNMQEKTSFNQISGDNIKDMFPLKGIFWILINMYTNNIRPKKPDHTKYKFIEKFQVFSEDINSIELKEFISPSRFLCNLFWEKINWKKIKNELGEINIHDTGCGDGSYSLKLDRYANRINSYIGIDSVENKKWRELNQKNSCFNFKNQTYLDF